MESDHNRLQFDGFEDDDTFYPLWYYQSRGHVDFREREAEEFNSILQANLPKQVTEWRCEEEIGWIFEMVELVLVIEDIGFEPLRIELNNRALPKRLIDPLRRRLRHILAWPLETRVDMNGFAMILLRLVEEVVSVIEEWKLEIGKQFGFNAKGWDIKHIDDGRKMLLENPLGADLDTIDTSGDDILGASIKDICGQFPDEYRILHVEPVFRSNLVDRFRRRKREIYEKLCTMPIGALKRCISSKRTSQESLDTPEKLAAELCKPFVTFHGTNRHVVSSIVRYGFIKPGEKIGGTGKTLEMSCGASFGIGIYSSPSPEYALWYSNLSSGNLERTYAEDIPTLRIIVCAVIMGMPLMVSREDTRRTVDLAHEKAHSHVSPNRLEYVVFDSAQIIPCYVVHLDLGLEEALEHLKRIPMNPNNFVAKTRKPPRLCVQHLWPAEKEAAKQAKKAAAAKWFPYGYGPAKGTSFVIEEIGEISDDEEDYGDYQHDRTMVENEAQEWDDTVPTTSSWFDEYQTSRVTWQD